MNTKSVVRIAVALLVSSVAIWILAQASYVIADTVYLAVRIGQ